MRKAEQPLYLRDFPQNKFVTELLLAAKLTDGSMFADIGNAQIDAAVAQTRAFFADEYERIERESKTARLPGAGVYEHTEGAA